MASMRDIRRRIKSVKSTQQITKAMKIVSAAKLRKVQASLIAARPYAKKVQEVMDHLLGSEAEYENALITPRAEVKKVCYVVLAGDRGLCGGYNSQVLRLAENEIKAEKAECGLLLIGKKARDFFRSKPYKIIGHHVNIGDNPTMVQSIALSKYLIEKYLSGEVDEVHVIYSEFISTMNQEPKSVRLLPIPASEQVEQEKGLRDLYIFEPGEKAILDVILPQYVQSTVYRMMLEAKAGEHGARMTSMSAATDNAYEIIDKLTLSLNRARQAAITTEISEIVGGAAALE